MGVYTKTTRDEAKRSGAKVITTRWIDIDKGDAGNLDYRCRFVGREIKNDDRPELFAATPLLEALRMVISICASNQDGLQPYRLLSSDVKRVFLCEGEATNLY